MTSFICPRCHQRIYIANHSGDFVHECVGDESLSTESVPLLGKWEDYTGSDTTINSVVQQQFAGIENTLQGTFAGVLGKTFRPKNIHGQTKTTHRIRQHLEYIENLEEL